MNGIKEPQTNQNCAPDASQSTGVKIESIKVEIPKKTKSNSGSRVSDLIGRKFGMLTVTSRAPNTKTHSRWNCVCECGKTTSALGTNLLRGKIKSCGCNQHSGGNLRHGLYYHPLYRTFRSMRDRCFKENNHKYKRYGGRGITVCQEWKDPEVFIKWALVAGWKQGLQIDRIDNDGNYCPENCRFVTNHQNSLNKSTAQSNNTSGFTGVSRDKRSGKYYAHIRYLNTKHIGTFNTAKEAVIARDQYIIDNNLPHRLQVLTRG